MPRKISTSDSPAPPPFAEWLRDDMLEIVSHDLRNPLGAIGLSTSMLLEREGDDPRVRKQLEIIRRSTDRIEHLISDLFDLAKIASGRLVLDRKPASAGELVAELIDRHAPVAAEKHLELAAELALDGVTVVCDRQRIAQVLDNLVDHAIRLCRPGDTIRVVGSADATRVQLVVRDTGPGLAEHELPHVFEPYWSARRHRKQGTGLGLCLAKGLVEAHGGTLDVTSKPGEGATFVVSLPVQP